jgi:hypothetical protein
VYVVDLSTGIKIIGHSNHLYIFVVTKILEFVKKNQMP